MNPNTQPVSQQPASPSDDANKIEIEFVIQQDGSLMVGLEVGENEDESQFVPAKSIDEACAIAKKLYAQVMSQSPQDQAVEDSAYQQEMASPTA